MGKTKYSRQPPLPKTGNSLRFVKQLFTPISRQDIGKGSSYFF